MIDSGLHPERAQPGINGFSHGLKTVHRTVFLTPFRTPLRPIQTPPFEGGVFIGGESGIRTHGTLPYH